MKRQDEYKYISPGFNLEDHKCQLNFKFLDKCLLSCFHPPLHTQHSRPFPYFFHAWSYLILQAVVFLIQQLVIF